MRAYVINLARSHRRREHIVAELKKTGLDYEIVPAVDGRELDLNDQTLIDPALVSSWPFPEGTAGCALSHVRVCQRILAGGDTAALVLEDDISVPADLGSIADAVAGNLTGAEVALLECGSFPPGPLLAATDGSVDLPSSRLLALPLDASQIVNTGAYVITREACQRMVDRLPPIRAKADEWRFFYTEGILDRIRCVLPQPVGKCAEFESEIGLYSLGTGIKARVAAPLVRHRIPVVHRMLSHRREAIMRRWSRVEVVDRPFVERPSRLG